MALMGTHLNLRAGTNGGHGLNKHEASDEKNTGLNNADL